jgi:hypothetical protein
MGKSKGKNHGKSIWSRQMEYANMKMMARHDLSELKRMNPKPPREIIVPQYIPMPKEELDKRLYPPHFRVEVQLPDAHELLILHRTSRKESEGLLSTLKKKFGVVIGTITNLRK